jgi:GT2 family glycosyltransferase
VELSHRIFVSGYKIVYAPEAVVYHRNEKTLIGLFREGYLHGVYSVQFIKHYNDYMLKSGHHRINIKSYKQIITDLKDFLTNGKGINSLCSATFNTGKKVGKIFGSFKYSYLDI